jgi:hypothetical protein
VTITSPTSNSSYTASFSPLTISGTASDNVGVTQVSWVTDRGAAGTASGTTNWTASGIVLQSGTNNVTVTARDAAGNRKTDVLTVTYAVATSSDTTPPAISIVGPTTASSYTTTKNVITLGGTASDNKGVTAVTWSNSRGGSGFSGGTTSWSVPSITLQGGTNIITVTAQDAAGNKATDVLTVTYSTTTTTSFVLSGQLLTSGSWVRASLQWTRIPPPNVEIFLNDRLVKRTTDDGNEVVAPTGSAPYIYKVCYPELTTCSNTVTLRR